MLQSWSGFIRLYPSNIIALEDTLAQGGVEGWFLQGGVIGAMMAVVYWFIQREDRREAARDSVHIQNLKDVNDVHEKTRSRLDDALIENVRLAGELAVAKAALARCQARNERFTDE